MAVFLLDLLILIGAFAQCIVPRLLPRLRRLVRRRDGRVAVLPRQTEASHASAGPAHEQVVGRVEECQDAGQRVLNVIAHPDDDLLFLSPHLLKSLSSGAAVWTLCVTSGDAGHGQLYGLAREGGLRAAYASMIGVPNRWEHRRDRFGKAPVHVYILRAASHVCLLFMRLPDGRVGGEGTRRGRFRSLKQLWAGEAESIRQFGGSDLTLEELVDAIGSVVQRFSPSIARTLDWASEYGCGDHSDHLTVGRLLLAVRSRTVAFNASSYVGYPSSGLPRNVGANELSRKVSALLCYRRHDALFQVGDNLGWASRQYVLARLNAAAHDA